MQTITGIKITMAKTLNLTVYTFEELNEAAQRKVLDKEIRQYQENGDTLRFFNEEDARYISNIHGFGQSIKLSYSFSYSQGDGCSFTSDDVNVREIVNKVVPENKPLLRKMLIETVQISTSANKGRYSFASKSNVNVWADVVNLREYWPNFEAYVFGEFTDKVAELYMKCCKAIEKEGYKIIEDAGTDEAAKERLECRDEVFYYADGEEFNYKISINNHVQP